MPIKASRISHGGRSQLPAPRHQQCGGYSRPILLKNLGSQRPPRPCDEIRFKEAA